MTEYIRNAAELTEHQRNALRLELIITRTEKFRNDDGRLKDDLDFPRGAWIVVVGVIIFIIVWLFYGWSFVSVVVTGFLTVGLVSALMVGVGSLVERKPEVKDFCKNVFRFVRDSGPMQWLRETPLDRLREIQSRVNSLNDDELVAQCSLATDSRRSSKSNVSVSSGSGCLALVVLLLGLCALNPDREAHLAELMATQTETKEIASAEDFLFRSIGIASFSFRSEDLTSSFQPSDIGNALSFGILNTVWRIKKPKEKLSPP